MNTEYENMNNPTGITNNTEDSFYSGKNLIIGVLTILLVLSFLGINLLNKTGDFIQTMTNIFGPLIAQVLSVFGYTAGTVLDKSADVVSDVAKTGIDVANGTVQSVADLLKDASKSNITTDAKLQLDKTINNYKLSSNEPSADTSVNPIQKPITSSKQQWCLVGEYEGKRGCIEVNDDSKCMSGQSFPSRQLCMNPTKTIYTNQ